MTELGPSWPAQSGTSCGASGFRRRCLTARCWRVPSTDTVKLLDDDGLIAATPARLRAVAGADATGLPLGRAARAPTRRPRRPCGGHRRCRAGGGAGWPVALVEGSAENLKVTTPLDLRLAERSCWSGIAGRPPVPRRGASARPASQERREPTSEWASASTLTASPKTGRWCWVECVCGSAGPGRPQRCRCGGPRPHGRPAGRRRP